MEHEALLVGALERVDELRDAEKLAAEAEAMLDDPEMHELAEAERSADDVVIMTHGRVLAQGALDQLAGDPVLVVETSIPVDPDELARRLGCAVSVLEPTRLQCAISSSPERVAAVTAYLSERGAALTGLRTRATLEERYLELVAETTEATS